MALIPVPATTENITRAVEHLKSGRLVAFPTETVYGLGADARNGKAVAQIFAAKGRPSFNPLIIHVPDLAAACQWAHVNSMARQLAEAFWPGGLTMVLNKRANANLSDLVSAGLPSIAVRVPSHPIAQALLLEAGFPIAAPSANRSGHVSATTAAHVAYDFDTPSLAMILDGGASPLGIESTIVDARGDTVGLLRPGAVTREALADVAGAKIQQTAEATSDTAPRSSPGQLESHYAPTKPVMMNVSEPLPGQALLAFGPIPRSYDGPSFNLSPSRDLAEAAANLFQGLRQLDDTDADVIAAMPIPMTGLGLAINDRLRRAAAPRDRAVR